VIWEATCGARPTAATARKGMTMLEADSEKIDIDYVAQLARLGLSAAERELFSRQLGQVLHYMGKLKELDVAGIEPMAHALPVANVWRADEPWPQDIKGAALANAPARRDDLFQVPKIVDTNG